MKAFEHEHFASATTVARSPEMFRSTCIVTAMNQSQAIGEAWVKCLAVRFGVVEIVSADQIMDKRTNFAGSVENPGASRPARVSSVSNRLGSRQGLSLTVNQSHEMDGRLPSFPEPRLGLDVPSAPPPPELRASSETTKQSLEGFEFEVA